MVTASPASAETIAARFGYEWDRYAQLFPHYEEQFRNWTKPIEPAFWQGKRVLDAGCGMGRNSLWCLRYGAADVVAVDYDDRTVAAAQRLLGGHPNARAERGNIYELSYEDIFDCAMSIGVIDHLEDPGRALQRLVRALTPGGTLLVWVYAREGNERLLRVLRPVRALTARLPVAVVHALTYLFSAPLVAYLRVVPQRRPYWRRLSSFSFAHVHSIVFDQLFPRVAHYFPRAEIERLCAVLPLRTYAIHHTDGYSWTVIGTK